MASRRMVDQAFWESETVAQWDYFQRLLFIGMFCKADDQGRIRANATWIRAQVFPFDDVDVDKIQAALDLFAAAESILVYEVDGTRYLQFLKWWTWQKPSWAWPSKYPAPPDWMDRVCYRKGNAVIKSNWDGNGAEGAPAPAPSEPAVSPSRPHSDPSVTLPPSTSGSGSTRDSTSGSVSNNNTVPEAESQAAVADVLQEVHNLGVTGKKAKQLVRQFEGREQLPELVPRLDGWHRHYAGKPGVDNPMGLAITQTEEGLIPPNAEDDDRDRRRRYIEGPHADIIES